MLKLMNLGPSQTVRSLGVLAACLVPAFVTACSDPVAPGDGSGGVGGSVYSTTGGSGSGATTGVGGSSDTGGAQGTGAGSGAGGAPGNGGSGTGGLTTGGAPGTGGETGGVGGATGGSGTGGSTGGAVSTCPVEEPLTGGMEYCSDSKGNAGNGYGYELWAEGPGSGCMTVHGVEATFSATWNDRDDFLARVGLDFNQTQTHTQIGTIKAEFAETKEEQNGGLTYIGIYGWTVNPLREFYILDDWGSEKPGGTSSDGTPRDFVGTLEADGETYDVWKKTRVDKPAITGPSETFDQYFSLRRSARQCGTISVSEHFIQWEELGLPLGNFHEVKLLLESQFNSGSISFTTARITVD